MRFTFSFDTRATPEQALDAFIDFGPRRPDIWRETLDPGQYEVRELHDGWAVVREGTAKPRMWAVERYDWSPPGAVRWRALESNFCAPGSGVEVTITPRDGGGSRVEAVWHRQPKGLQGFLLVPLIRVVGPKSFPNGWRTVLDRFAEEQVPGPASPG